MILEFIVKGFREEAEKIAAAIDRRKKLAKHGVQFKGIDRRQKMYKQANTIGSLVGSFKPLQATKSMVKAAPKAPNMASRLHRTTTKGV